jgi:hypothetical protein
VPSKPELPLVKPRKLRFQSRRQAGSIVVGGSGLSTKQTETYDSHRRPKVPTLPTINSPPGKVRKFHPLESELLPAFSGDFSDWEKTDDIDHHQPFGDICFKSLTLLLQILLPTPQRYY